MRIISNSSASTRFHGRRSRVRGIALIEALVSLLIFSTGILGVIGLQASMTRAQGVAKFRADAAVLSTELVGSMWGDITNFTGYAHSVDTACTHTPCARWVAKVAKTLPKGAATIVTNSGVATITITWFTPTDGSHNYVTTTVIQ